MNSVAAHTIESAGSEHPLTLEDLRLIEKRSAVGVHFEGVRQGAFARLAHLPPLRSDLELWRYTRPELFPWTQLGEATARALTVGELVDASERTDLFAGTESVPAGVTVNTTLDASKAEALNESFAREHSDAAGELVIAATTELVSIRITKGTVLRLPLLISQRLGGGTRGAAQLTVIHVEAGASVTVIEDLSDDAFEGFLGSRLQCVVEPNARLEFISLQRLGVNAQYYARQAFHLRRDAALRTAHVAIGGAVARVDLDCCLEESGANADLHSLYLGRGTQHLDFHPSQIHLAPRCRSDLYCKGALLDRARAVYFGYIRVSENAQKTDAYQKNKNVVLSERARIDSIPNLEIKANDVKCSHGSSTGQVSAEELFYLMSRGLSRAHAERLLVEGFFADLIAKISNERVRNLIEAKVAERLG